MLPRPSLSALLVILLLTGILLAQPPRGRGRLLGSRPTGLLFLTSIREVRDELALGVDQAHLLDDLAADVRDQQRAVANRSREGADAESGVPGDFEAFRDRMRQLTDQADRLVLLVLEPDQGKRLQELRLQHEGLRALEREEVATALGLSDGQLTRIRQLRARPEEADRSGDEPAGEEAGEPERWERDLSEILSNEQRQTLDSLKGKPFVFPDWLERFDRRRR